jgi:glycosyltransferase 2 family protein
VERAATKTPSMLRRGLLLAAKLALAAALVTWLWRSGRLDLHNLARVRLDGALLLVIVGQIIVHLVPPLRWSLFLKARDLKLTARQILQIGLISYFAVLILPATGGQEAVRLYYANRIERGRGPDFLATLVLDRFVGLFGLCVLALLSGLLLLIRTGSRAVMEVMGFVAVLLVVLAGVTVFLLRSKPRRLGALIERSAAISALFRSLEAFRGRQGVLLASLGLSCLGHLGSPMSMYFGFLAIGAPVPFVEVCAITPLVLLTSSIPVTPLGIGVADVAADRLFTLIGVLHGAEVTMLVRAVTATAYLACGLAYIVPLPGSSSASAEVGDG